MTKNIKVSICCSTYNQRDYIEQALESFIMQKTNFDYEVLVTDDASTDGTIDIIKKYEEKYPHIIKPIYQKENQYSKGIKVGYEYNIKRANGKYIALCEGDDYWIDKYKLQKQVDYMEDNPSCTLCVHSAQIIDGKTNKEIGLVRPYNVTKKCNTEDFIIGGGGFVATNSILFPKAIFKNPPKWYFSSPVGDYPMQIFLATQGYAYYIDDNMSAYRVNAKGSWTRSMLEDCENKYSKHYDDMNTMLDQVNKDTKNIYINEINQIKRINNFNVMVIKSEFEKIIKPVFRDLYNNLSKKTKFKIFIKRYFKIVNIMVNYKRRKLIDG